MLRILYRVTGALFGVYLCLRRNFFEVSTIVYRRLYKPRVGRWRQTPKIKPFSLLFWPFLARITGLKTLLACSFIITGWSYSFMLQKNATHARRRYASVKLLIKLSNVLVACSTGWFSVIRDVVFYTAVSWVESTNPAQLTIPFPFLVS